MLIKLKKLAATTTVAALAVSPMAAGINSEQHRISVSMLQDEVGTMQDEAQSAFKAIGGDELSDPVLASFVFALSFGNFSATIQFDSDIAEASLDF